MTGASLFANDAPLLDDVELLGISLKGQPLLAFPSVTKLCYEGRVPQLAGLLAQLPSLQRLTLVTSDADIFWLPAVRRVLDIQIRVDKAWDASRLFPHARSICYALGNPHAAVDWEASRANLSVTLKRIGRKPFKSLDMRLSRLCFSAPGGFPLDLVRMTVKADGVAIAVDVDWIRQTALIISHLNLGSLETLVLHEGIWEDLMDLELPFLTQLTIQLRHTLEPSEWWPLKRPRAARPPWPIAVLRLSRTPAAEEPVSRENGELPSLKAADIAVLISCNCEPSTLEQIVLRGWELAEPGVADLRALASRALIRFEDAIACDDWVQPAGWPTHFVESEGVQL